MEKETFDILSKQYSPLIKWIIESNQIYFELHTRIRWMFGYDDNLAITATTNRDSNVLSINILFVDDSYQNNRIFEIEYFLLHEMRHVYQHNQIELFKNNKHTADPKYIKLWSNEGQHYVKSLDSDGNENIEYFKQDCELDAYAFSYAVMHHKYYGIYDSEVFIPKIYKNELKTEFNSAFNDFLRNF